MFTHAEVGGMKVPETMKEGEVADISEGWEDDWEVRLCHVRYRIAGNFRGRKVSQISLFCAYQRKFSQ